MTGIPGLPASIPETALQDVDCGLCGSSRRRIEFIDGPFSVVTCAECDLTYVTPRLSDVALIDQVYDERYWSSPEARTRGYTDYRRDASLYLRTYRRRMTVVKRHFERPGRVLDVGCAAGYFLSVMQGEGWEVLGLEPSDAIRTRAEELIGGENVMGSLLGQADLEAGSFDMVTMWDVIEHIPDPVAALGEVRRVLRPGGKLLIETQNVASRAARILGKRWQHYKHAEHIYHFNPETLARVLERARFRELENSPRLGGKYVSMAFIAERVSLLHPLLSTLLSPLKLLANRAVYVNLFDEMIVVAEPSAE